MFYSIFLFLLKNTIFFYILNTCPIKFLDRPLVWLKSHLGIRPQRPQCEFKYSQRERKKLQRQRLKITINFNPQFLFSLSPYRGIYHLVLAKHFPPPTRQFITTVGQVVRCFHSGGGGAEKKWRPPRNSSQPASSNNMKIFLLAGSVALREALRLKQ